MTSIARRTLAVWAACLAMSLGSAIAIGLALGATLSPEQRKAALALFEASGPVPYLLSALAVVVAFLLASWIVNAYFSPIDRAAEATRVSVGANPNYRLEAEGPREFRRLIAAINALADRLAGALHDVDERIAQARADLEREKNRLAVLMSELAQSVVVCNRDGQIVLYNEQARRLFSRPGREPAESSTGFIGLGRSLYSLLESEPLRHAIGRIHARTEGGELDPIVVFTTMLPSGALVRVRIAPMAGVSADRPESAPPSGFVLVLEDISDDVTGVERRDRILIDLIERSRSSLASLRAAAENLAEFPEMDAARRARFLAVAVEESRRLGDAVERASREHADSARRRPRALESMRAADLLALVHASLAHEGYSARIERGSQEVWLDVDCHALLEAMRYLARRLKDEFRIRDLRLAATADADHAYFDIGWTGVRISPATAHVWETEPLSAGGAASSTTLRDILQQHDAEFWHEIDRPSGNARFRIMLPLRVGELPSTQSARRGRPVFYDFDLSFVAPTRGDLEARLLQELAYTVFDTETTGLQPLAGDEIISIGAVRIVNGRVLVDELFEQLVDPRRPIQPESAKVHGIRDEMLRGQPDIAQVLPRFHRFCADAVLVGHNVAFDLRFLQMKERATGVAFRQPALDTLLLSAVVYESLQDHRLEAIAHRLGIEVVARHTAVGDAILTAEVFIKLLPMLAERGIRTLGQAHDAAKRTRYAKLRY